MVARRFAAGSRSRGAAEEAVGIRAAMSVTTASFGTTPECAGVDVFRLTNAHGVDVRIITYGAAIASLAVPDRHGQFDDIVAGFDDLDGYVTRSPFFGAVVGRYANRIADARFTLAGRQFQLAAKTERIISMAAGADSTRWYGRQRRSSATAPPVSRCRVSVMTVRKATRER
jgi:galactose mutarotase-like enzyme